MQKVHETVSCYFEQSCSTKYVILQSLFLYCMMNKSIVVHSFTSTIEERDDNMGDFPDIFPDNFVTEILPQKAEKVDRDVFRVIKSGIIDREGFISTYEEIKKGIIPPRKKLRMNDPKTYSTSCSIDYKEAKYVLSLIMRHHPAPVIAKGITSGSCGPSQETAEREGAQAGSHVDWWVYKDSEPQKFFHKVENDEE